LIKVFDDLSIHPRASIPVAGVPGIVRRGDL
jgi:hypothetical protein